MTAPVMNASEKHINVHLLPALLPAELGRDSVCVVFDVLRASTTIVHALESGAKGVIACETIEQVRQKAADLSTRGEAGVLLGGERDGLKIDGFDLGNSPAEYSPDVVRDKLIVMTTTNGTRALAACRGAGKAWIGSLTNRVAVAELLHECDKVHLVCAGTRGEVSYEDVLAAGAVLDRAWESNDCVEETVLNDAARLALGAWRALTVRTATNAQAENEPRSEELVVALRKSQGGQNVERIGLGADIVDAARLDRSTCVPMLDDDGVLRAG